MIATFYSFKGGAGRTLALANIAVLLAQWGNRVLAIDFDLEAPGLSKYLTADFDIELDNKEGLLDLLLQATSDHPRDTDWRQYVQMVAQYGKGSLSVITCGRQDNNYPALVLSFDWHQFFEAASGGEYIELLRDEWGAEYDFVLIDSRTGFTDAGGICTIQLPDVMVAVFTASEQSVAGVIDVIGRAQRGRQALAYDRPPLSVLPLPSRFDTRTEYELAQDWLDDFAIRFKEYYESWLPKELSVRQMLERMKLPYVAYFSFGEHLPVLREGTSDPESLGFALRATARLLNGQLSNAAELLGGSDQVGGDPLDGIVERIERTEGELASANPMLAKAAWKVLTRMVDIEGVDPFSVRPGSFDSNQVRGHSLADFIAKLPAVRLVGDKLGWADERIVSRWHDLQRRVDQDRDFLLWTQRLHKAANERLDAYLVGPDLLEAISWRDQRPEDLTRDESLFIEFSEQVRRSNVKPLSFAQIGRSLRITPILFALTVVVNISLLALTEPRTVWIEDFGISAFIAAFIGFYSDFILQMRARKDISLTTIEEQTHSSSLVKRDISRQLALMGYEAAQVSTGAIHYRLRDGARSPVSARARGVALTDAEFDVFVFLRHEASHEQETDVLVVSGPRTIMRRLKRSGAIRAGSELRQL